MKISVILASRVLFSLAILVGCNSLGPRYAQQTFNDKTHAHVYVYRISRFAGSAGSPYVCIDGKVVGELVNGGYFEVELAAGVHTIAKKSMGQNVGDFSFLVQSGKTYYVRSDFSIDTGAQEAAENAQTAGLGPGGGGALGEAMTSAFYGGSDEKKNALDKLDTRAEKKSANPGFLMVNTDFGGDEIQDEKLFKVPDYKKNFCAPPPKAEQKETW